MKLFLWLAAALAFATAATPHRPDDEWTVVIMGDTQGYLSPCGCTYPMSGGIVRRAQALAGQDSSKTLVLDVGHLSGGLGRQNEMKAECLAEAMSSFKVDAAVLAGDDLRLGPGFVTNLSSLGRFVWLSASPEVVNVPVQDRFTKGPFRVFLADEAGADSDWKGSGSIVLVDGDVAKARELAGNHSGLAMVVYRSSTAPREPERVGDTLLVSCGARGKAIVQARWSGGKFVTAKTVELDPQWDAAKPSTTAKEVAGAFRRYLGRVEREGLVEAMPRTATPEYAGPKTCSPCHQAAATAWAKSAHNHALTTLEDKGQARDPECLPCHVTGLDSTVGFRTRKATPTLADVTCESCHGPLKRHAAAPAAEKPPKVGRQVCATCHTLEHDPRFDFDKAWPKIAH